MTIGEPGTAADLDAVRDLMRAFAAWHRERHTEVLHLIDGYVDAGEFEAELAGLPGWLLRPRPARRDWLVFRELDRATGH